MDNERQLDQPLPTGMIETVRTMYTPPGAQSYWALLESRIMARIVRMPSARWWQVLDGWARTELLAAAAVLAIVGALLMRANATELHTAYDAVAGSIPIAAESLAIPAGALSERESPDVRGTTFGDVISQ